MRGGRCPGLDDLDEVRELVRMSLGPALIDWSEGRTEIPGLIHHQFGAPWRWTRMQRRFLVLWYHLDEAGRFTYRSGIVRGAKGVGKDPFAAGDVQLRTARAGRVVRLRR